MAVTQENLLIEISANTAKASQAIDQLTLSLADIDNKLKTSNKSQKESAKSLNDFGMLAAKASGVISVAKEAFNALSGVISATVGEFQKAQTGVQSLADTLAMMGEKNVNKSLEQFLSLADEIQKTTMVDDDTVIALAKIGVAAGRSDKEIEKMVKTSVNMAAVTGGTAKDAMDALIMSYTGQTRELNRLTPELKNLTESQIKAGAAVDILAKKFDGAGKSAAQSFQGQLAQIENKTSDMMEELGRIISTGLSFEPSTKEFNRVLGYFVDVVKKAGPDIAQGLAFIKGVFDNVFNGITFVIWETIKLFWQFIEMFADAADAISSTFGTKLDFGKFTRANIDQLTKLQKHIVSSLVDPMEQAAKAKAAYGKDVTPNIAADQNATRKPSVVISDEAKQALEELRKKAEEFQKQNMLAGQSEFAQIKIKAKLELDELDIIENKLRLQNSLNAAAKANLETARQAIKIKSTKDESAAYKKEFEDLNKQRTALERSNANVGKTPYQAAVEDQKRQLDDLEKQRAKLQEEGKLPKSGPMNPEQQRLSDELDAAKKEIQNQQLLGHSESFNKAKDVGDQIAVKMTTALEGPVMGSIMGAMSGAMSVISVAQGVIDMAQQLVDAIPKLLNSFANLVNSIVELPLKIAEAIGNVINSVMNIIKNAIPNAIQAVMNIVDAIRNFVREAPKQFVMMVDKSVEMITKFMDDLPNIAQEMAQNLTEAIPKTMAKSIEFAMLNAPKIMMRLIKMIYTELPPAIWHGIMEGFKEFGRVFQRWMKGDFSGQKMKLDIDTEGLKKQLGSLTKDASRLFTVGAIADAAKNAANEAKKIDDAAKKSGKNMWQAFIDAMVKGWQNFLKAGGEIWNGLIMAIGDIAETFGAWGTAIWNGLLDAIGDIAETLGAWGTAIWNGVTKAVGEIAKTFGEWGGAIWTGLTDMVKDPDKFFGDWGEKIWKGFLGPIGEAFSGFGTAIWGGVTTAIGELPKTFGNWGKVMWNGFTDLIKDPAKFFGSWGTKIWNGFFGPIGDAFSGFGTAIFDGLKEALKGVGSLFSDLGGQIFNGLKSGLDTIGNVLSKMFQFDGGGTGTVENFIGMDFPFVSFAKGGLVPGKAAVPGDSLLNDRIPALLSPGEVVLPRSVMGDEAFRRVVMAKLSGQEVPQFAGGGVLGGVLGNIIPKWIRDLYDSISKYIGGIDLVQLARDPKGTITNALKDNINVFKDNFKQMVKGYAEGGLVTGPGGTDVVPGMLTAGEFVLNRNTVGRVGLGNIRDLNSGKAQLGTQTSNVTVNLTVNTSEKLDESFIRQRLMPAIRDELKRNSLDGRTIVYAGGVRK